MRRLCGKVQTGRGTGWRAVLAQAASVVGTGGHTQSYGCRGSSVTSSLGRRPSKRANVSTEEAVTNVHVWLLVNGVILIVVVVFVVMGRL